MVLCERAYKEVECMVTLVCYNRQKDMCFVRSISLNWRCQFTKHVFSSWSCFELGCEYRMGSLVLSSWSCFELGCEHRMGSLMLSSWSCFELGCEHRMGSLGPILVLFTSCFLMTAYYFCCWWLMGLNIVLILAEVQRPTSVEKWIEEREVHRDVKIPSTEK